MTTFRELRIADDLAGNLETHHITAPFPIQEQAIPLAVAGKDLLGQAKTGTGKTLAYGLPILQQLGEQPDHTLAALIVVPTRELAGQVHDDLSELAELRGARITAIYGGHSYDDQIAALGAGSDIVVGTPGRLLDLHKQGVLDLAAIRYMVLDEADKMLDLGFLPDVERIFGFLPEHRQTMLFSATMPGPVIALSRRFMTHPVHVQVADPDEGIVQGNIKQFVYRAHPLDKAEIIARILQAPGRGRTIVFTRTKRAASRLADDLTERGFKAIPVHGDLTQDVRERNLDAFRSGIFDVLVATDVAARGIDVEDVTHVINHSIPEDDKDYLHRIGRTGRAGKTGIAVTFVDWQDVPRWHLINEALQFGQEEPTETYSTSAHLYADLNIPEDANGRLASAAPVPSRSRRPARRDDSAQHDRHDGEEHAAGSGEHSRRRRSRGGRDRNAARDGEHRERTGATTPVEARGERDEPRSEHGQGERNDRAERSNDAERSTHSERSDRTDRDEPRSADSRGRRSRRHGEGRTGQESHGDERAQSRRREGRRSDQHQRSGRPRRNEKVVLKAHQLEHGALAGGGVEKPVSTSAAQD